MILYKFALLLLNFLKFDFLCQNIDLAPMPIPLVRCDSPALMIIFSISPRAYNFLRHLDSVCERHGHSFIEWVILELQLEVIIIVTSGT